MLLANCLIRLGLHQPVYLPSGYAYGYSPANILEIGIGQFPRLVNTSTFILTSFKHGTVRYIGIDKNSRSWVNEFHYGYDVLVYKETSENILKKWREDATPTPEIDLLFIDGDHSVNGVLIDWEFTRFVKNSGIIVLHDIKAHPGPKLLVDAIDRDYYTVHKMFLDDPKDFGMAVVYKKENEYDKMVSV